MNSDIPLPKDPRHQRFADLVLVGTPAAQAYKEAGFKATTPRSRAANASRMLKIDSIRKYMDAVKAKAAEGAVMDVREILEFCARVKRVPVTGINPDDPDRKDADLIRKFERNTTETGETYKLEKLDPFKAIEIHLKLSGQDPDVNSLHIMAEALASLAPKDALPTNRM